MGFTPSHHLCILCGQPKQPTSALPGELLSTRARCEKIIQKVLPMVVDKLAMEASHGELATLLLLLLAATMPAVAMQRQPRPTIKQGRRTTHIAEKPCIGSPLALWGRLWL